MSGTDPEGWRRFHPLSPLLRGGLFLVAVLGYLFTQVLDDVLSSLTGTQDRPGRGGGPQGGQEVDDWLLGHPIYLLLGLGAGLLVVGAAGAASWWFTRFRLGESTIELRTGAVFRQHRQIRYARVQAVSINRPILARVAGLSEVRVESAGGDSSNVRLAYLRHAEALDLESTLLGLVRESSSAPSRGRTDRTAAAVGEDAAPAGPATPGTGPLLVDMPFGRLLASTFLSWTTIFVLLTVPVALLLAGFGALGVLGGFVVPIFFAAVNRVRHVLTWSNLTVRRTGDALAVAHGLTDVSTSTVPVERVQAVELSQPWLWRWAGWWRLSVNVAGVQFGGDAITDAGVLVPVGTSAEIRATLDALSQGLEVDGIDGAMHGELPGRAYRSPRAARWLDPATWRRNGTVLEHEVVIVRRGWPGRVVQVVPHGRIQSMGLEQGPLQRRLDLAQVRLVSTVGAVVPVTSHLRTGDAEALYADEAARASAARGRGGPVDACESAPDTLDLSDMESHRPEGSTS